MPFHSFSELMELCNHHHNSVSATFSSTAKAPLCPFTVSLLFHAQPQATTRLLAHSRMVFSGNFYISGTHTACGLLSLAVSTYHIFKVHHVILCASGSSFGLLNVLLLIWTHTMLHLTFHSS